MEERGAASLPLEYCAGSVALSSTAEGANYNCYPSSPVGKEFYPLTTRQDFQKLGIRPVALPLYLPQHCRQDDKPSSASSSRPRTPPRRVPARRTSPYITRTTMGESGSGSGLGNGRGQASALPGFQQTSTGTFNSPPNSREALREVARETQEVIGRILEQLSTTEKAESSSQYNLDTLRRLNPFFCPAFSTPTKIQVLNEDTLNAGLALLPSTTNQDPSTTTRAPCSAAATGCSPASGRSRRRPPSSASSASSALRNPRTQTFRLAGGARKTVFQSDTDRDLTKRNMRLVLRIAAHHRHRHLVLGALGCGVYANPPEDVAHCWLEVLREDEFSGGWWQQICFAVFDPSGTGNYEVFMRVLHDQNV
ncbi:hypothetical protein CHGG_10640 [Chaetomium globosum CBS 148.51]|uniref:Microbial-type PARG catalytic domain-containing protein n=1 Tax=Chaetomium globosum (strain ATCC 6205 / CBS 148.51 / DSM 1962 / NBRC 6347 / NRRL 1970) TaxID=306901 RepID=Q2GN14_CHAGB|nr:uncharacterized protein CHGG_10640 [Chaetomium globosum CBS 148.51]EAQ84236.1 hypothetical protein CHGG_10640 [Chaetomium globosum CBS 148.51]